MTKFRLIDFVERKKSTRDYRPAVVDLAKDPDVKDWVGGGLAKPPTPHRTVQAVFPHTALQLVASRGLNESSMGFTQAEESQLEEEFIWPTSCAW